MAISGRAARPSYYYHDYTVHDEPLPRRSRHHRSRSRRDDDYDSDEEAYIAARRERRERRQAEQARRDAEQLDIDELRARRHSYYTQPEPDRRRDSQRMAQSLRPEREPRSRSPRALRHDGTRRKKKSREVVDDDRIDDDYVYARPRSRGFIEEVTVRRSSAPRRSEEGASSSRTPQSPISGSRSASSPMADAPKVSRSKSTREPARAYMATRPSIRRSKTMRVPAAPQPPAPRPQHTSRGHHQRKSTGGLLATLFATPARASTIAVKEIPRVECVICLDELPSTKTAKLGCGHRMCHSCLKRQFTLSVHDPQHMPPKCCTSEHIPLRAVERLFDDKFKRTWNKKYQEYTTSNRLYCPNKGCGEWIKPSKIRMDMTYGRRYARCGRCDTKVCALCNNRFHTRRDCPRDPDTKRLVQLAEDKGWQRCYHCKTMVELKEGCNHMTCRCKAQFCMVCARPWKTCNCPWFSYDHLPDEGNRLNANDMRIPALAEQDVIEVIEEPPSPPAPAATSPPPAVLSRRISARTRRERNLELERAVGILAARMQAQLNLEASHSHSHPDARRSERDRRNDRDRDRDPAVQVYGVGNAGTGHHMNESYTVRPIAVSTSTNHRIPPPHQAQQTTSQRRNTLSNSIPSIFTPIRHLSQSFTNPVAVQQPAPVVKPEVKVRSSTMAGLSRDGSKRGAGRVGTWLNHVETDFEAVATAPRGVECDVWEVRGGVVGID